MDTELFDKISGKINNYRDSTIKWQSELVPLKAMSPENGGDGEYEKAKYLENVLRPLVDELNYYNAEDKRVSAGFRPNIVGIKKGKDNTKRLLLLAHMDVVPTGDTKLWKTDPWKAVVRDGKIYGRGSEDNNQAIVSFICLLKALKDENITPPYDIVTFLLSDEECGNKYGIKHLVANNKGLFRDRDVAIAPDSGKHDGEEISVAEKMAIWMKVTTKGKEAHGAYPNKGKNAHYAAAEFVNKMESLYKKYDEKKPIFDPPFSTFEATKKEPNVPNVNTIPGEDVVYFDCRLLPSLSKDDFLETVEGIRKEVESNRGVKISIEFPMMSNGSSTSIDSPIVKATEAAVRDIHGVEPSIVGIGGQTFASMIRNMGIDTVVYSKLDDVLHEPDEYCVVENVLDDAKVFAYILLNI